MSFTQRFYRNGRWVSAKEAQELLKKRREKELNLELEDGEEDSNNEDEDKGYNIENELNLMTTPDIKDLAKKAGIKYSWTKTRKNLIKELLELKKSTDNK